jgi:PAS domain S-box-containing protein
MKDSIYKGIIDAMPSIYINIALDGKVLEFNNAMLITSGYTAEELSQKYIYEIDETLPKEVYLKMIEECVEKKSAYYRQRFTNRDGVGIYFDIQLTLFGSDPKNQSIVIILTNTTREVEHSDEVEFMNSVFFETINNSYRGLVIETIDKKILYVNDKFYRFFNVNNDLSGKGIGVLIDLFSKLLVSPQKYFDYINACFAIGKENEGIELELHDGRVFIVSYEPVNHNNAVGAHIIFYNNITEKVLADRKMVSQQMFYNKIIEDMPIETIIIDAKNLKVVSANNAAVANPEITDWAIGKKDLNSFDNNKHDKISEDLRVKSEMIKKAIAEKKLVQYNESSFDKSGVEKFYQRYLNPYILNGEVTNVTEFGVDVTEIKLAENKLHETQVQLLSLIESEHSHIWSIDNNYGFIYSNSTFKKVLKESFLIDVYVGYNLLNSFNEKSLALTWKSYYDRVYSGETFSVTHQFDKPWIGFTMEYSFKPIYNDHSEIIGASVFGYDLTELIGIQSELVKTQNSLMSLINTERAMIWSVDNDLVLTYCNDAFKATLKKATNKEIKIGDNTLTFADFPNNILDFWKVNFERALNGEDVISVSPAININSSVFEYTFKPIYNNENSIIGVSIFGYDLTEITEAYRRVEESEVNLNAIVLSLDDVVIEMDFKGDVLQVWNYNLNGLPMLNTDLIGKNISAVINPDKATEFMKLLHSCIQNKSSETFEYKGENKYYQAKIRPIELKGKVEKVSILVKNISDQKRQQKLLSDSEKKYKLISDEGEDLISMHSMDGVFTFVSNSYQTVLGYNEEELIGKSALNFIQPEHHHLIIESLQTLTAATPTDEREFNIIKKDGSFIYVEGRAKAIFDENNNVVACQVVCRDIRKRKEADETLKQNLEKEKALNSLRTNLVSTISHEFRTPLSTMFSSSELIEIYLDKNDETSKTKIANHLEIIKEEITRITQLMNDVLLLTKSDSDKISHKIEAINLVKVCETIIENNFANQKDKRKVITHFHDTEIWVQGDKNLITYSITNLINNAFKYSQGRGDINLILCKEEQHALIKIIDKGIGIPETDMPFLFNTFYRAKNTDGIPGTGLGLVIVKTFIERNSGKVFLESEFNKGTTATIQLPIFVNNEI